MLITSINIKNMEFNYKVKKETRQCPGTYWFSAGRDSAVLRSWPRRWLSHVTQFKVKHSLADKMESL